MSLQVQLHAEQADEWSPQEVPVHLWTTEHVTRWIACAEGGRFATASEQRAETFLVSFGVSKALCNGLAGWLADARGRRAAMLVGWAAALALAPAVLFAQSGSLVVAAAG